MFLLKLAKHLTPFGMLRIIPYLLIVPIMVFLTLSLTGCVSTSPGVDHIYVVSLRPNTNATNAPLVRVGYFGICGVSELGTRCQSASGQSVATLATNLFSSSNTTSNSTTSPSPDDEVIADLLSTALDLQSRIFISVLAGAAVLFVLGLVAMFLFRRDTRSATGWEHPRRSLIFRRATYGMLAGSAALAFAAALATSESAGALEYATSGMSHATVLIHAGKTQQVFQWIAFGFEVLFVAAVPFLVRPGKGQEQQGQVEGEWKGEA